MTYTCDFCRLPFILGTGSYAYIHTKIVAHLDKCPAVAGLSAARRRDEATLLADATTAFPNEYLPRMAA